MFVLERDYGNFTRLIPKSTIVFIFWGKSHVRSVLHTDLVKIAQPEHSGATCSRMPIARENALKDKPEVAAGEKKGCPTDLFDYSRNSLQHACG
jgi:hypothetical protein